MSKEKYSKGSDLSLILLTLAILILVFTNNNAHLIQKFYVGNRISICMLISILIFGAYLKVKNKILKLKEPKFLEDEMIGPSQKEPSVFVGITKNNKAAHIKQSFRRMHTQVIGTTNAGKTESVILPWAIDDLKKGYGMIIIDGKSELSFLHKLYAYAIRHNREKDIRILSLCNPEISHTFNPLSGGTVLEITERVFNALTFENEYFKTIQYDAFLHCLLILEDLGIKPTPIRVIQCLKNDSILSSMLVKVKNQALRSWGEEFVNLKREEREQRTSGLIAQLQGFAVGEMTDIFNSENSDINLDRALKDNEIIYCQLPALKIPTLGKAAGKMILQCLQSAVASRHLDSESNKSFFTAYLDDFTEYLSPNFVTLLNKSRSANVAVVFAHQALGDLSSLGEGVKNTILTNSNLKIFMRTNDPDSANYFSNLIGTVASHQITERQTTGMMGATKTGDGSVRETEEYKFHPNVFKQELGLGEGVVVLPHSGGSYPVRIKFKKTLDIDAPMIPKLKKIKVKGLEDSFGSKKVKIEDTHAPSAGAELMLPSTDGERRAS